MSQRMDEIRRRLSEGESIFDITWGAGWQVEIPIVGTFIEICGHLVWLFP